MARWVYMQCVLNSQLASTLESNVARAHCLSPHMLELCVEPLRPLWRATLQQPIFSTVQSRLSTHSGEDRSQSFSISRLRILTAKQSRLLWRATLQLSRLSLELSICSDLLSNMSLSLTKQNVPFELVSRYVSISNWKQ